MTKGCNLGPMSDVHHSILAVHMIWTPVVMHPFVFVQSVYAMDDYAVELLKDVGQNVEQLLGSSQLSMASQKLNSKFNFEEVLNCMMSDKYSKIRCLKLDLKSISPLMENLFLNLDDIKAEILRVEPVAKTLNISALKLDTFSKSLSDGKRMKLTIGSVPVRLNQLENNLQKRELSLAVLAFCLGTALLFVGVALATANPIAGITLLVISGLLMAPLVSYYLFVLVSELYKVFQPVIEFVKRALLRVATVLQLDKLHRLISSKIEALRAVIYERYYHTHPSGYFQIKGAGTQVAAVFGNSLLSYDLDSIKQTLKSQSSLSVIKFNHISDIEKDSVFKQVLLSLMHAFTAHLKSEKCLEQFKNKQADLMNSFLNKKSDDSNRFELQMGWIISNAMSEEEAKTTLTQWLNSDPENQKKKEFFESLSELRFNDCVVCTEPLSSGTSLVTKCGHAIHHNCLRSNFCPSCRTLDPVSVHPDLQWYNS